MQIFQHGGMIKFEDDWTNNFHEIEIYGLWLDKKMKSCSSLSEDVSYQTSANEKTCL